MAAGSPVSERNKAAASASVRGPVLQAVTVAALTITPTSGSLPTADGAITIANTATPTVVELLEFCVELNAKFLALKASLQTAGSLA